MFLPVLGKSGGPHRPDGCDARHAWGGGPGKAHLQSGNSVLSPEHREAGCLSFTE